MNVRIMRDIENANNRNVGQFHVFCDEQDNKMVYHTTWTTFDMAVITAKKQTNGIVFNSSGEMIYFCYATIYGIDSMPALTKLGYFVYRENTFGFLFKTADGCAYLEVLASNRNGVDWQIGPIFINHFRDLRPATLDDFEEFRVSPKGHIYRL